MAAPQAVFVDSNWIRNPKAPPTFLPTPAEFEALMRRLGISNTTRVIAYVVSGRFECQVGGETRVLHPGDAFIAPRLTPHGVVALDADATLLDQFSPRRDDYL